MIRVLIVFFISAIIGFSSAYGSEHVNELLRRSLEVSSLPTVPIDPDRQTIDGQTYSSLDEVKQAVKKIIQGNQEKIEISTAHLNWALTRYRDNGYRILLENASVDALVGGQQYLPHIFYAIGRKDGELVKELWGRVEVREQTRALGFTPIAYVIAVCYKDMLDVLMSIGDQKDVDDYASLRELKGLTCP